MKKDNDLSSNYFLFYFNINLSGFLDMEIYDFIRTHSYHIPWCATARWLYSSARIEVLEQ